MAICIYPLLYLIIPPNAFHSVNNARLAVFLPGTLLPSFLTRHILYLRRYRPARGAVYCGNQGSVCVFDAWCFRRADEPLRRAFEHAHHGHTVEKNKIHAGLHRCLRCVRAQPRTAARRAMADRLRRAGVYSRARAVFGRLRHLYRAFAAGFTPAAGEAAGFEEIVL